MHRRSVASTAGTSAPPSSPNWRSDYVQPDSGCDCETGEDCCPKNKDEDFCLRLVHVGAISASPIDPLMRKHSRTNYAKTRFDRLVHLSRKPNKFNKQLSDAMEQAETTILLGIIVAGILSIVISLEVLFQRGTQFFGDGYFVHSSLTQGRYRQLPESGIFYGPGYSKLRREDFDRMNLPLPRHIFKHVQAAAGVPYDVDNCPSIPPDGYPLAWPLKVLIRNWNPNNLSLHQGRRIHQGLCRFDFRDTRHVEAAKTYREMELPFVARHDPTIESTVRRWNHYGYLRNLLDADGQPDYLAEVSETNVFPYWFPTGNTEEKTKELMRRFPGLDNWRKPPTRFERMTFDKWMGFANGTALNATDGVERFGPDQRHYYLRLTGCGDNENCKAGFRKSSGVLFDELSVFDPQKQEDNSFRWIVDETKQNGIHCRFGMPGVTAVNHYDSSRNAIAVLGGARRYILTHPDQCKDGKLTLYPIGHPSDRHSCTDWTDPTVPEFATVRSNEVVLEAGDISYVPSGWFHFIVSLTTSFQCNSRSGASDKYDHLLAGCDRR